MEEDKISRQERNALRKEKETLRQARQGAYVRELMDDLEGRPEEVSGNFLFMVLLIWITSIICYIVSLLTGIIGERNGWN